ncbi:MAG: protein-L-isoaspartate O-methyltransferase family protein [Candidatus Woesearchaeota archaeon]
MDKRRLLQHVQANMVGFVDDEHDEELLERVLKAMDAVDRRHFVSYREEAYLDTALPISTGQTISQPSTVARMLLLLKPERGDDVLEAGAGSGWQAALLAWLVHPGKVVTLDLTDNSIGLARENLSKAKKAIKTRTSIIDSVDVRKENVYDHEGRYDRVVITAGITEDQEQDLKKLARRLLKDQGRLVCPYRSGPMLTIDRQGADLVVSRTPEHYLFVPLQR